MIPGDWAVSIDLTDAYHHIPIFPKHRQYLRFFSDRSVLPMESTVFRPNISTQGLYNVLSVVMGHLHTQNIRIVAYLDDLLILNQSREKLAVDRETTINLLVSLGFITCINAEKSSLTPSQTIVYLGTLFHLEQSIVLPTNERAEKLYKAVKAIISGHNTANDFLHLLGIIASCIEIIPNAKLFMRPIQLHLLSFWRPASQNFEKEIPITQHLISHLQWWLKPTNIKRQTFCSKTNNCNHNNRRVKSRLRRSHVLPCSSRGMVRCTKRMAYQSARDGSSVSGDETLCTKSKGSQSVDKMRQFDGRTIHKQTRGTRSYQLCYKTWDMWNWAIQNNIQMKAVHIAGKANVLADKLSRQKIIPTEWTLNRMIVHQIFQKWGYPTVDLFASHMNKQTEVYCSLMTDSRALAIDALSIPWQDMFVYAYSPLLSHSKSATTHVSIQVPDDSNSSSLAKKTLVHKNYGTTDSMSNNVTSNSGSAIPAKVPDQSSESRAFQTDGLVSLNRQFEKRGSSEQTRKLFCSSWRKGTQKDYVSKFKTFSGWCDSREIDPYTANLTQVAEFLTFLYTSGLQYRTIAGYRSMFSSVLESVENKQVCQHPYIVRLLKGIFNSRPPKARLLPEWDLPRVLKMLEKAPFEPMRVATLKAKSRKYQGVLL